MDATQLMAQYCDGDAQAFRELYALVAPRLFGYLIKLSRHRTLAADLLQSTFMKVHRSRTAYIRGADPEPWIYAIAHRTFIDEVRKQRRETVQLGEEHELASSARLYGGSDEHHVEPPDSGLVTAALAALARLPVEQRQAVVLTKLEGRTFAQAAEITGASVTAMKVRAHRGYKALRGLLATDAGGAP